MINIIDLEKESMTDFERKYMFTEAPDDQERVNVKRIRLKAPDRRTYDFKKGAGGDDDTTETPDNTEELDDTGTSGDTVEDPDVNTNDPTETDDATGDAESIDMNDDSGASDDIVTDDEAPTDDQTGDAPDDGGSDAESIDMGDDSGTSGDIVTDDDGDISTDDANDDQNAGTDDSDTTDGESDGDNKNEGIHKQNLYKKFVSLKTSVDNYEHKLSSIIGVDPETHEMMHRITDKMRSLSDMMYDYMILKFKNNTYLESMLFYQRALSATKLCLDALAKVAEITEESDNKKSGNSRKKEIS